MPAGAVIVRVDVPVPPAIRVTLAALKEVVSPAGDEVALRLTAPAKLLRLVNVMVEVAEDPTGMLDGLAGLAAIVKSGGTPYTPS